MSYRQFNLSPITGILMLVLSLALIYLVIAGIWKIASFLLPFLLLAAVLLHYPTVLNYGKWLLKILKIQPLQGVVAIVLSLLFSPFVVLFLFVKALLSWQMKRQQPPGSQTQGGQSLRGDYIDFEEIRDERVKLPRNGNSSGSDFL